VSEHPTSLTLLGSEHPQTIAAPATFDLILREIAVAKESIEIFMYVWRSDKIGNEVATAVLAAADRGVKIRIIKDIGAFLFERIEMNRKSLFNRPLPTLKRIVYKLITPTFPKTYVKDDHTDELGHKLIAHPNVTVDWVNETHTKYYLFDDRLLITGSINIEDRHFGYYDYMLALDDPAIVSRFRQRARGEVPHDPSLPVDFLSNSHRPDGSVFEIKPETLRLIECAEQSIYVEMAYLGDEEVTAAFIAAAKRGVKVSFLFSKEANIGNDLNYRTIQEIYTAADVSVHLTETMIHSKLMMIDDHTILTGSANLSVFSMQKSEELDLIIHDHPALITALQDVIAKRLAASPPVTSPDQLSHFRPLLAALQQWHQKKNPN
jgi:phosphatidylserine/phosphatidylglycerophosphate/cardiolipin synthase-like enzyme